MPPERFDSLAGVAPGTPRGDDLVALRLRAGLTLDQVATWTGQHRSTVRRQERGQARVCVASARLLAVLAGCLPWAPWAGWTVRAGALTSPDDARLSYTPGELLLVTFAWQLARAARAELRRIGTPEEEIAQRLPAFQEAA